MQERDIHPCNPLIRFLRCTGENRHGDRDIYGFPPTSPGLRVGLLGGSFDPPHEGHVHITRWALRRFQLDRVWWLISPGNPLKTIGPAPLERRIQAANSLVAHPRVIVTDLERRLGTRYTSETLRALRLRYPLVRFVWLMGADNLVQFHRWEDWDGIMMQMPLGIMARPEEQVSAGMSHAARKYARFRLNPRRSSGLALRQAPAWSLLTGRMLAVSSSEIRARGEWISGAEHQPSAAAIRRLKSSDD